MALALQAAVARGPWRIRLYFSGGNPSGQPASAFSLARADGGANTIRVLNVFSADQVELELVTTEPLIPRVVYNVTWSSTTVVCSLDVPADVLQPTFAEEDVEAEIFGVDYDWIYGMPGPDGDCPRRTGQDCLTHDLAARAQLKKGELVHLPTKGADLPDTVNGPAPPADLQAIQATLDAEFRDDDRVKDVGIDVGESDDPSGWNYNARVIPIATGIPLKVSDT